MEWMMLPLKRYAEFTGRSRRKEYWMFVLFSIIVGVVAGILDRMLGFGTTSSYATGGVAVASYHSNGPVGVLVSLGLFIPSIAVSVRRLHDTDRSGWWLLLSLLPIAGWIVLLIFVCQDGTPGPNAYGADPKDERLADVIR